MKAEVIKEFRSNGKEFKKGDLLNIEEEAVVINDDWICDVESQYFQWYFKLIED